jgi:2-polyprenyl-3-methyl-5-hydroxy-6-metoxy-1,4-benzoquinol methylase
VSDREYTRRYFSDGARRWLAGAYTVSTDSPTYPVGSRRVALALDAVRERLGRSSGRLLDLGCGGGDLCLEAAGQGFEVCGVDIAEGMIAEAEERRAGLPPELRSRVSFVLGDALGARAEDGHDAVTAIGLLEYLPDDAPFFERAASLVRPGGVLVVSCRNRLFNMASLNDYTGQEVATGAASELLDELTALQSANDLHDACAEFLARLRQALPVLEAALAADRREGRRPRPAFGQPRRQHTPRGLVKAAAAAGLSAPAFIGVHPHPWPPAYEHAAPRLYNRLAEVFEAFQHTPPGLVWSSAFLGVFTR